MPDTMKRAMGRQAEAEREKRAKIINAEGESLAAAALGEASDAGLGSFLAREQAAASPPPLTTAGPSCRRWPTPDYLASRRYRQRNGHELAHR